MDRLECLERNKICSMNNRKCKDCKLTDCRNTLKLIEEEEKMWFETKEELFQKELKKRYPRVCRLQSFTNIRHRQKESILSIHDKRMCVGMKFNCNNSEWKIKEVDEATINNEMKQDGTLGVTIYKTQEILLLKDQANIIKTLKHELMHVWLYEYGHNQDDENKFSYEDVCEIVASSNDFVNEVVDKYTQKEKTLLYAGDKLLGEIIHEY